MCPELPRNMHLHQIFQEREDLLSLLRGKWKMTASRVNSASGNFSRWQCSKSLFLLLSTLSDGSFHILECSADCKAFCRAKPLDEQKINDSW